MKSALLIVAAFATVPAIPKPEPTPRARILATAAGEIGVREATGRNDGEVDKYLASVGLKGTRAPYCAAFNYWVGQQAMGTRNPYPRSAWSPDHLRGSTRVTATIDIHGGEAFGIWFTSKKRIAHTGLAERRDGSHIITIEANTNADAIPGSAADRDGSGVHRKRRHWRTVHSLRDWPATLTPPSP